jgi:hypothetical protein
MCGPLRRSRRAGLESGIPAGYGTIRPTCSRKKTNGLWKQNSRADRQKTAEGKIILFRSSFILPIMQAQNYKTLPNLTFFLNICCSGIIICLMFSG